VSDRLGMNGRESVVIGGTAITPLTRALQDLLLGLQLWRLWSMLGWADIRQRYRRAIIGPFWISLSMGAMVGGMGVVYGALFHQPLDTFLPFLAGGFTAWFLISTTIGDGATAFVQAEGLIKQGGLPLSLHLFRVVWRNLVIYLHNLVVILVLYGVFGFADLGSLAQLVPGSLLVTLNLTWMILIIGPLCTRFRDMAPIVANLLQLLFFVTPIVFQARALAHMPWVAEWNPFFYLVEAIRAPLLGQGLGLGGVAALLLLATGGWAIAVPFFARVRARVPFWL
jgi:lipopolysaccharide transport system permease protein